MSMQPEALRLVDVAFAARDGRWHTQADDELRRLHVDAIEATAELRRLHTENERLHQINQSHEMKLSVRGYEIQIADLEAQREALLEALRIAEAALSDIGDADREPGDDVAWCEARAAEVIPQARAAIKAVEEEA